MPSFASNADKQDRHAGRSLAVGRGQPRVERPDRHLHHEPGHERKEKPELSILFLE